jgi:hypothetical protein
VIRVVSKQHPHHKTLLIANLRSTLHGHLLTATEKRHGPGQQHPRQQTVADRPLYPEISAPPELPKPHTFQTAAPQR